MTTNTKITLYYNGMSQPSRSVQALLEVSGLNYDMKVVGLLQNDHRRPYFKLVNPNQSIPGMVDAKPNGVPFAIYESGAMLRYICNKYLPADNEFYPRNNPVLNAKIEEKMRFYHKRVRPGTRTFYFRNIAPFLGLVDRFDHDEDIRLTHEICKEVEDILDENGGWIVEKGRLTIADILIFNEIISYGLGDVDLKSYQKIKKWMLEIIDRDGIKKTLEELKGIIIGLENQLLPFDPKEAL